MKFPPVKPALAEDILRPVNHQSLHLQGRPLIRCPRQGSAVFLPGIRCRVTPPQRTPGRSNTRFRHRNTLRLHHRPVRLRRNRDRIRNWLAEGLANGLRQGLPAGLPWTALGRDTLQPQGLHGFLRKFARHLQSLTDLVPPDRPGKSRRFLSIHRTRIKTHFLQPLSRLLDLQAALLPKNTRGHAKETR